MFNATAEQVADEESIVWLEDTLGMPYLRERVLTCCTSRRRRPRFTLPGRLIGYGRLRKEPESACGERFYTRRIFWLKPYDYPSRGPYQHGDAPFEAVVPGLIAAGKTNQRLYELRGLRRLPDVEQHQLGIEPLPGTTPHSGHRSGVARRS